MNNKPGLMYHLKNQKGFFYRPNKNQTGLGGKNSHSQSPPISQNQKDTVINITAQDQNKITSKINGNNQIKMKDNSQQILQRKLSNLQQNEINSTANINGKNNKSNPNKIQQQSPQNFYKKDDLNQNNMKLIQTKQKIREMVSGQLQQYKNFQKQKIPSQDQKKKSSVESVQQSRQSKDLNLSQKTQQNENLKKSVVSDSDMGNALKITSKQFQNITSNFSNLNISNNNQHSQKLLNLTQQSQQSNFQQSLKNTSQPQQQPQYQQVDQNSNLMQKLNNLKINHQNSQSVNLQLNCQQNGSHLQTKHNQQQQSLATNTTVNINQKNQQNSQLSQQSTQQVVKINNFVAGQMHQNNINTNTNQQNIITNNPLQLNGQTHQNLQQQILQQQQSSKNKIQFHFQQQQQQQQEKQQQQQQQQLQQIQYNINTQNNILEQNGISNNLQQQQQQQQQENVSENSKIYSAKQLNITSTQPQHQQNTTKPTSHNSTTTANLYGSHKDITSEALKELQKFEKNSQQSILVGKNSSSSLNKRNDKFIDVSKGPITMLNNQEIRLRNHQKEYYQNLAQQSQLQQQIYNTEPLSQQLQQNLMGNNNINNSNSSHHKNNKFLQQNNNFMSMVETSVNNITKNQQNNNSLDKSGLDQSLSQIHILQFQQQQQQQLKENTQLEKVIDQMNINIQQFNDKHILESINQVMDIFVEKNKNFSSSLNQFKQFLLNIVQQYQHVSESKNLENQEEIKNLKQQVTQLQDQVTQLKKENQKLILISNSSTQANLSSIDPFQKKNSQPVNVGSNNNNNKNNNKNYAENVQNNNNINQDLVKDYIKDNNKLKNMILEQQNTIFYMKDKECKLIKLLLGVKKQGVDLEKIFQEEILNDEGGEENAEKNILDDDSTQKQFLDITNNQQEPASQEDAYNLNLVHQQQFNEEQAQLQIQQNHNQKKNFKKVKNRQKLDENGEIMVIQDQLSMEKAQINNQLEIIDFADQSIINDSDESSFNYFGKDKIHDSSAERHYQKQNPNNHIILDMNLKKKLKLNLSDLKIESSSKNTSRSENLQNQKNQQNNNNDNNNILNDLDDNNDNEQENNNNINIQDKDVRQQQFIKKNMQEIEQLKLWQKQMNNFQKK